GRIGELGIDLCHAYASGELIGKIRKGFGDRPREQIGPLERRLGDEGSVRVGHEATLARLSSTPRARSAGERSAGPIEVTPQQPAPPVGGDVRMEQRDADAVLAQLYR